MEIAKAHGERELFDEEKLHSSSIRAGASVDLADSVTRKVARRAKAGMSSSDIYEQVLNTLQKESPPVAARYSLKRAIMEMGPTGYPFERYVAELLGEYGYRTAVGQIIMGRCVNHEIDVIAQQGEEKAMVECKFHNRPGTRSDVKVSLYVYARYLDVINTWRTEDGEGKMKYVPWLVTNTKVTDDAARYGQCAGLRVTGWRYPVDGSLEKLVESKKLYPLTVLQLLSRSTWALLSRHGFVLCRDILQSDASEIGRVCGIKTNLVGRLQEEARAL